MVPRHLFRCRMVYKLMIKKIIYFIGLSVIFGSLCIMLYIAYTLLTKGYINFIEPNLILLVLEFIWIIIGFLVFPFIIKDIIKMNKYGNSK